MLRALIVRPAVVYYAGVKLRINMAFMIILVPCTLTVILSPIECRDYVEVVYETGVLP